MRQSVDQRDTGSAPQEMSNFPAKILVAKYGSEVADLVKYTGWEF